MRSAIFAVLLSIFVILWSPPARPDGCPTRRITGAERDFQASTLAALKKALPPVPAGWGQGRVDPVKAEDQVCVGQEKEPMRLDLSAGYIREEGRKEHEDALRKATEEGSMDQDQQAQMQDLIRQQQEHTASMLPQLQKAIQSHDTAEIKRISAESEKFNKGLEAKRALFESGVAGRMSRATEGKLLKDFSANVSFVVNSYEESVWKGRLVSLRGFVAAVRTDGYLKGDTEWVEGTTRVFLGPWKVDASDARNLRFKPRRDASSPLAVQSIMIEVRADEKRAEELIKAVDLEALQALLR